MIKTGITFEDLNIDISKSEFFFCKGRNENVNIKFCIDSYVDVNALNIKDSPCFKCSQGQDIREAYANS